MSKRTPLKYLTTNEFQELQAALTDNPRRHKIRNRAILLTAEYAGLRASELRLLQIQDFVPERRSLHCHRLKHGRDNTLYILDQTVYAALLEWLAIRNTYPFGNGCLFPSQKGNPISRQQLDLIIKQIGNNAGTPDDKRHMHVLRHTCAIELFDNFLDISDVQYWLGHKNIESTLRYLAYTMTHKRQMYIALYNRYKKGGAEMTENDIRIFKQTFGIIDEGDIVDLDDLVSDEDIDLEDDGE